MFCKECGHRFKPELEEDICPICYTWKGKGEKFCPFCGEEMVENGQVICHDCGLNIHGAISQMGDGTIDTGLHFYHIKGRNLLLCALLMLLSCGAYGFYWFIRLSEEYAVIAEDKADTVLRDLLLTTITCGLYGIYWGYKQAERYESVLRINNKPEKDNRILWCVIAAIGSPVLLMFVLQYELNQM